MAMLAAHILASAFAPHDQWLYPVKVAATAAALWWYRDSLRQLIARVSWTSVVIGLAVGVAWIATDSVTSASSDCWPLPARPSPSA